MTKKSDKLMSPANKFLRDVMKTIYGRDWKKHAIAAIASRTTPAINELPGSRVA